MTDQPTPEIGPRPMPFSVDFGRAHLDGQAVTVLTIRTLYGHLVLFADDAMSRSIEDNLRKVRGGLHIPVNGFQHPGSPT